MNIASAGRRAANGRPALKEAMAIDGATGFCLVDCESGMSPGALDRGKSNLAMARHNLKRIAGQLVL